MTVPGRILKHVVYVSGAEVRPSTATGVLGPGFRLVRQEGKRIAPAALRKRNARERRIMRASTAGPQAVVEGAGGIVGDG